MIAKILIVDDDIDTLHLVGMMLQRQGYQIIASNTGRQALALLQSEDPDLIILDVMMPDLDGYEVTRRIRSNPAFSNIPIMMFTAKSQVDDKVGGYEAGVDDYITKPTLPRDLFAHVKSILERSNKERKAPPAKPDRQAHTIGILSAKGGLGNSTLAANLGVCLHQISRKSVIVAELRPGEGTIGLDLGCSNFEGLARLLVKRPAEISLAEIQKEIQLHSSGLMILPASYNPQDAQLKQCVESIGQVAQQLSQTDGYVLLDLGPGIPASTSKIFNLCCELIIVMEPQPVTILRSKALINEMIQRGIKAEQILPVLVNRSRTDTRLTIDQVQTQLGRKIEAAFTPSPELIIEANEKKAPVASVHPESSIAKQFYELGTVIS